MGTPAIVCLSDTTMRATLSLSLLLAIAHSAHTAQVPLQADSQVPLQALDTQNDSLAWDKDPDVDATGNRIFTSVSELMQLWAGTVVVQGHSFAPCIIPAGTIFYHGRGDALPPTVPDWLAFDFEHSYFFAFGADPHVLTLAARRPLRILDFDGLSAHYATQSQSVIMHGAVVPGSDQAPAPVLGAQLCAWAAQHGVDGFIRMEEHFELIVCDFADSLTLLSALRVIPQAERTEGGGGGGRGPGRTRVPRPEGWIGALPTDSRSEVEIAGKWHDFAPGETRVRLVYSKFVTFYDPALTSLVAGRRGTPRDAHTLTAMTRADAQTKLRELENALARPWDEGSGVDWASVVRVVVERYGERLAVLNYTLSSVSDLDTAAFHARQQVLIMLVPHFTTADVPSDSLAWLAPVVERCATIHTRAFSTLDTLTKQEETIKGAVDDVMAQICRRLGRMFHAAVGVADPAADVDSGSKQKKDARRVVAEMRGELGALMEWLDWVQVWVRCRPACGVEETCVVPRTDRRNPTCVRRPNL
ncbi:hypothetical protein C8R46DRAFT_1192085 [Mycena filopes]|nr:hypothetical protein C8R46DRAFT_1192085 [Mycena filopes]